MPLTFSPPCPSSRARILEILQYSCGFAPCEDGESELELLRERLKSATLPEDVRKEADRELTRLDRLSPQAPDYNVGRTWLELILELPWTTSSQSAIDIAGARKILADDHYGLEKVKEHILEHLGVLRLNPAAKSPILCFVGPPGVGKTCLLYTSDAADE